MRGEKPSPPDQICPGRPRGVILAMLLQQMNPPIDPKYEDDIVTTHLDLQNVTFINATSSICEG
jgi:hypothetical protein